MIPRPALYYPRRNLADHLAITAGRFPETTGLVCDGESLTYRELDALANSTARALMAEGLQPGDRVLISMANNLEWPIALFGILRAGGVLVVANPRWNAEEMAHARDIAPPTVAVTDETSRAAVTASGVRVLTVDGRGSGSFWTALRAQSAEPVDPVHRSWTEDEALLFFSSGTTGMPKAVRHSHYSMGASVINWKSAIKLQYPDRQQFVLPLFTGFGVSSVIGSVMAGVPLYLSSTLDIDRMLQEIQRERITHSMLVAPVAHRLAARDDLESFDLSSVRVLVWAATAVNESVARRISERTGLTWVIGYGMTELLGLHCNPAESPELCRLDSVGVPRSDCEIKIVDTETGAEVPAGEEGEILARSPARMLGYLPETANADVMLPDGWLRTGDIGKIVDGEWLILTDRLKDLIKVSGLQVAPAEVESVLLEHPDVVDCAVVGQPDERRGEVPAAFLVVANPIHEERLREWLAARLSTYKIPGRFEIVASIPRTASGKTLRRELRAGLSGR